MPMEYGMSMKYCFCLAVVKVARANSQPKE